MIDIKDFISIIPSYLRTRVYNLPWKITEDIKEIILEILPSLGTEFKVENGIAIHKSVVLSPGTILKKDSIVKRLELIEQFKEK